MNHPRSGLSLDRGLKVATHRVGAASTDLLVWVPSAPELVAIEQRHRFEFGSGTVTIDELSEALVRWRQENPDAVLAPAAWEAHGTGRRIPIPVVTRPTSAHPTNILEGHASVSALLSLQPVPQEVAVLVAMRRL